jgi:HEAT repeat protein
MGLLAACVFLVLAPQAPVAAVPIVQDPPTAQPAGPSPDEAKALATLEKQGDKADVAGLAILAGSNDAAIAKRAAWVLANSKNKAALRPLQDVVAGNAHADARVFAMQAVLRFQDVSATQTAVDALRDADRRVRTLAAEFLGKLKRPAAVDPLLGLVEGTRTASEPGAATDVQAALLALHDLGAVDKLLRIATALHDSKAEGTGEALAFCCQNLSPKLPAAEQTTFLLAILGHREPLVRRFAIGRLGELADPTSAKALEGHLGNETKELRPLVEVALARVRNDKVAPPTDEVARATHNLQALLHTGKTWWNGLEPLHQGIAAGVPVVFLIAVVMVVRARRRRAHAAAAAATIALVQPSETFAAEAAAEAEQLADEAEQYADEPAAEGAEQAEEWQEHDVAARR